MQQDEITARFDKQAASYDQQWSKMAAIYEALYLLTSTILAELPTQAKILCVGAGTGAEILYLAQKFPEWHFTAVEPSIAMLEVFRRRAEEHGISTRCVFHAGYLDSLPPTEPFDAATAFLVSQFILERPARSQFFQNIAERLRPAGLLVSADLAGDLTAPDWRELLGLWSRVMTGSGTPPAPEAIERMHQAYSQDVAVLPPGDVGDILRRGGFDAPMHFFQAGMIHGWVARRSPSQEKQLLAEEKLQAQTIDTEGGAVITGKISVKGGKVYARDKVVRQNRPADPSVQIDIATEGNMVSSQSIE